MYFTSFLGQVRWLWQKFQNCQGYRCKAGSAGAGQERFTRNKPRKWLIKGMDITMVTVTDSNLSEQESKGIKPKKTCWLLLTKLRLYFSVHSIHTLLTLCFSDCDFCIIFLLMCIPFLSIHNQDECWTVPLYENN